MLTIRGKLRKHGILCAIVVSIVTSVGLYLMALVSQPLWFLGILLILLGPIATWLVYRSERRQVYRLQEELKAVGKQASGGYYTHYDPTTGQRVSVYEI